MSKAVNAVARALVGCPRCNGFVEWDRWHEELKCLNCGHYPNGHSGVTSSIVSHLAGALKLKDMPSKYVEN